MATVVQASSGFQELVTMFGLSLIRIAESSQSHRLIQRSMSRNVSNDAIARVNRVLNDVFAVM
jgi:hypothetical protein